MLHKQTHDVTEPLVRPAREAQHTARGVIVYGFKVCYCFRQFYQCIMYTLIHTYSTFLIKQIVKKMIHLIYSNSVKHKGNIQVKLLISVFKARH